MPTRSELQTDRQTDSVKVTSPAASEIRPEGGKRMQEGERICTVEKWPPLEKHTYASQLAR